MKTTSTPVSYTEPNATVELDDIESAKLQAREMTLAIIKKSTKWVIVSFFVAVFVGCMYLWISSFTLA